MDRNRVSLKITEIAYTPMDTLYVADQDYCEYNRSMRVNQQLMSEAKTKRDKELYAYFIESDKKYIDELIERNYSAQQLSPTVYTEPLRAYFVSVKYKCKNGYGVDVEHKRYFNVVQWKSSVKQPDGSIKYAYDCNAIETTLTSKPAYSYEYGMKFI